MMKQLVMLGIVVGLVACGQEDSTQPAAESNNWYDTDGSGGPGETTTDTTTEDKPEDSGDKPEDESGDVKPDEVQTPGLSWSADIDLSIATGSVELTSLDDDLSECTSSASVSVEDYSETTCEGCAFQAGLRFDDIPIADETPAACAALIAMRGTRIDVAHGATLVVEYAGVNYHELLQMDENGEFSVVDQGYSAVMSNTQWVLGTK